jgi:predicted 3-demethylubiquinone-9 3-methyltransferase (glyoxalase superfamily)
MAGMEKIEKEGLLLDIKYGWKQDRFGVSAQVAAEELERIKEKHKTLEPKL